MQIGQDIRFALRLLRRDRAFAVTAVVVLAVGIGINNMFFTILHAHTLRGLPIAAADRMVYISTLDDRSPDRGVSYPELEVIRDSTRELEAVAAFTSGPVTIAGDAYAAERVEATFVSANAFELIGAAPLAGRGFGAGDDREGTPAVAMLGNRLWRSRYGGDVAIVGQPILVNGAPVTVAGVVGDATGFPATGEIWLTLGHAQRMLSQPREARTLRLLGRLRQGGGIAAAQVEIDGFIGRLTRESAPGDRKLRARVMPINDRYFGRLGDPAWRAFIAASVLVALISWANAANLMLTRAHRRARELAIRSSLGAQRSRLLRQLLIEGMVIAAAGAAAGALVSVLGVQVFRSAIPERALPYWVHYSVDLRIIAALIAVSVASVAVFALLPALRASKADVNGLLKEGGRPVAGDRSTGRWSTAFLAAEFALAVVLLAQLVVSVRAGAPQVASDRIVDTRAVVTAAVAMPAAKYPAVTQRVELFRSLQQRIGAIPGVAAVSFANVAPLSGGEEARLQTPAGDVAGTARAVTVTPGYFTTLDVPLVRGRDFADHDGTPGQRTVIVNERFATRFLTGDPIGQQITVASGTTAAATPLTIVAVAADVRQRPQPESEPVIYLPYPSAGPASMVLMVRSSVDPAALVPLLRKAVLALDPDLPVSRIQTMTDVVRNAQWNARLSQRLILLITFVAVVLSTFGLYAVTAHGVAQRTQEIGVRMALGARPREIVRLVARRVGLQVALGFAGGIICTLAWERAFTSGRADLSIAQPGALATIAITLATAALVAAALPALRATRLDPVAAIRGD